MSNHSWALIRACWVGNGNRGIASTYTGCCTRRFRKPKVCSSNGGLNETTLHTNRVSCIRLTYQEFSHHSGYHFNNVQSIDHKQWCKSIWIWTYMVLNRSIWRSIICLLWIFIWAFIYAIYTWVFIRIHIWLLYCWWWDWCWVYVISMYLCWMIMPIC